MPDIETAFDRLRHQTVRHVTEPAADRIIARARRRRIVRGAGGGVVIACAAVFVIAIAPVPRSPQHPVVSASPSPTGWQPPPGRGTAVHADDLLYAPTAHGRDWSDDTENGWPVPECGAGNGPTDWQYQYALTHTNAAMDDEARTVEYGENVRVFHDTAAATRAMTRLIPTAAACHGDGRTLIRRKRSIGDGSWSVTVTYQGPQVQRAVVVRQGAAIAVYWDMYNSTMPGVTMAQHLRDARVMDHKLRRLGYVG